VGSRPRCGGADQRAQVERDAADLRARRDLQLAVDVVLNASSCEEAAARAHLAVQVLGRDVLGPDFERRVALATTSAGLPAQTTATFYPDWAGVTFRASDVFSSLARKPTSQAFRRFQDELVKATAAARASAKPTCRALAGGK